LGSRRLKLVKGCGIEVGGVGSEELTLGKQEQGLKSLKISLKVCNE